MVNILKTDVDLTPISIKEGGGVGRGNKFDTDVMSLCQILIDRGVGC